MAYKKYVPAFTIVELLVVIVVIGILAAITIVSYTGLTQKATIASLQSDLANTSNQLKMFQVTNTAYPNSINDCPTPAANNICAKSSPNNSYTYSVNNTLNPSAFYLADINTNSGNAKVIEEGLTNYLINSDFETDSDSNGIPDNWSGATVWAGGAGTVALENTITAHGDKSYALNKTNATGQLFAVQSFNTTPGNTYTYSCWVKSNATGALIDLSHDSVWTQAYVPGGSLNKWARLSVTFTNTTTTASSIRVGIYDTSGIAYFDECQMIIGANPFP